MVVREGAQRKCDGVVAEDHVPPVDVKTSGHIRHAVVWGKWRMRSRCSGDQQTGDAADHHRAAEASITFHWTGRVESGVVDRGQVAAAHGRPTVPGWRCGSRPAERGTGRCRPVDLANHLVGQADNAVVHLHDSGTKAMHPHRELNAGQAVALVADTQSFSHCDPGDLPRRQKARPPRHREPLAQGEPIARQAVTFPLDVLRIAESQPSCEMAARRFL